MNGCSLSLPVSLIAAVLFLPCGSPTANADVVFEFDYSEAPQFLDDQQGATRRASLEDAGRMLGGLFDHNATIQLKVTSENDPNSGTLASAFSDQIEVDESFFGFAANIVEHKILTGVDANGPQPDGEVTVNFGEPWDYDDDISSDHFDFKATIIHELVHALGFASAIFEDGTDIFETPPGQPGVWAPFDQHLTDKDGRPLINPSFALNASLWQETSIGGASPASGLFFNGPSARAANGGSPVGLYSPRPWEDGSSGSHLDDDNPALQGMIMLAVSDTGQYTRELSTIERAILSDLGYSLSSPEDTPPQIAIESIGNQRVRVTVSGSPGTYKLRSSTNLTDWSEIATLTLTPDNLNGTYETTTQPQKALYFSAEHAE